MLILSEVSRGWPEKRRRAQAQNCRKIKPWEHTTGPKTKEGKNKSKNNSLKHGFRSVEGRELMRLMAAQRCFVRSVMRTLREDE